MYSGSNDFFGTRIITNKFEDGLDEELIKDSAFYPFIMIRPIEKKIFKSLGLDVSSGSNEDFTINIEKLSQYVKFQMTIKYKINGKSTY